MDKLLKAKKDSNQYIQTRYNLYEGGKNEIDGITLIALVITIMILLILAGISIVILTRDSEILKLVEGSNIKTVKEKIEEEMQLAYNDMQIDNNEEKWEIEKKANELQNELRKVDFSSVVKVKGKTLEIFYKGYKINISKDGLTSKWIGRADEYIIIILVFLVFVITNEIWLSKRCYECRECGNRYVPTNEEYMRGKSFPLGYELWRRSIYYMKCPKCKKKSWHRRVTGKHSVE